MGALGRVLIGDGVLDAQRINLADQPGEVLRIGTARLKDHLQPDVLQRLRSVRFFTGRTMPQAAIDVGGDTFAERLELIDAYLGSPNKPYAHLAHVAEGRTGQPWWMDGPHVPTSWWAGDPPPEALGSGARSYAVSLESLLVANSLGQAEAVAQQFRR